KSAVAPTRFEAGGKWSSGLRVPDWAGAGDFDGPDARGRTRTDLAWRDGTNGRMAALLSSGSAFKDAGGRARSWAATAWMGSGDFDGDHKDDIVAYQPDSANGGRLLVARSTGRGFLDPVEWLGGLHGADWAGVGDFDGDGKKDIVWYQSLDAHRLNVLLS